MPYLGALNGTFSIIIVILLYLFTFIYVSINIKINRNIITVLFLAILLRLILAILNYFYLPDFLPHSGADTISFERTGYYLFTGALDIGAYSGDNYPLFIYLVYSIFGREPFIIIGINGVLSVFASYFLYKSTLALTNDAKKAFICMAVLLFFPHSFVFSSVILRENMIVFFVSLSIFMFIKYTQQKKIKHIMLSFVFLAVASSLHAGVMFLSFGMFYYLLRDKGNFKKIELFKKPIIFLLIAITIFGMFTYDDLFLRKFASFDSVDTFVDRVAKGTDNSGGSAYLQGYDIKTLKDVATFAPLKLVYFFFSPMPWDLRNIKDIIALMLDALIYFYLFIQLIKRLRSLKWKEPSNKLFLSILIGIFCVGLVFALGTSNAGTALRHRYKILPLVLLALYIPVKSKMSSIMMREKLKIYKVMK